jgi:hypothetical protein
MIECLGFTPQASGFEPLTYLLVIPDKKVAAKKNR